MIHIQITSAIVIHIVIVMQFEQWEVNYLYKAGDGNQAQD